MVKGRRYIRNETSSNLPGNPLVPAASRPNRRIRLWELESQNATVRALERAYEQSLAEVDKLSAYRADIAKSDELTDPGKSKAITKAALQSTATLKAARNAIDKGCRAKMHSPTDSPGDSHGSSRTKARI